MTFLVKEKLYKIKRISYWVIKASDDFLHNHTIALFFSVDSTELRWIGTETDKQTNWKIAIEIENKSTSSKIYQ